MATLEDYDLIQNDPDWINLKRFGNSLNKLLDRYPEGCPSHVIAGGMMIDESEVDVVYAQIVVKLRRLMGVGSL